HQTSRLPRVGTPRPPLGDGNILVRIDDEAWTMAAEPAAEPGTMVGEPFQCLIAQGQLMTHRHRGFWACMDTFEDKQLFDEMTARAEARPWEVWRQPAEEMAKSGARRHCPVP